MKERSLRSVPKPVVALLALALALQMGWQAAQPQPVGRAEALPTPATTRTLQAASLGEPIALAQWLSLYLQAFDNQPGVSIPFRDLDYQRVVDWLTSILDLYPAGQYPLMMASQLYAQVPDETRQRLMMDFVHRAFLLEPETRWRWLAHCAIMAKHRLKDSALALRYADDIARYARDASSWARQMRIFMRADLGEIESATVLLGGLLAGGEITDQTEIRFLTERLEELKNAGKSSTPSKN